MDERTDGEPENIMPSTPVVGGGVKMTRKKKQKIDQSSDYIQPERRSATCVRRSTTESCRSTTWKCRSIVFVVHAVLLVS